MTEFALKTNDRRGSMSGIRTDAFYIFSRRIGSSMGPTFDVTSGSRHLSHPEEVLANATGQAHVDRRAHLLAKMWMTSSSFR